MRRPGALPGWVTLIPLQRDRVTPGRPGLPAKGNPGNPVIRSGVRQTCHALRNHASGLLRQEKTAAGRFCVAG